MENPADIVDTYAVAGKLFTKGDDQKVICHACAHRCKIAPGRRGVCQVRFNREGEQLVPHGYVAGAAVDPIEKKPFAHFLPGSEALTFGMLGCNLKCNFCQNWFTSQALRDPEALVSLDAIQKVSAEQLIQYAKRSHASIIASSYNEPLITSEWAMEIFRLAVKESIDCVYISNGFATSEVLEFLQPCVKGFKVDLKTMQDAQYRQCGGRLQPVLDSIIKARNLGMWVEVVTLVIPGFNDSNEELWDAARFISSVSPDVPWHVTAFHPDYHHTDASATTAALLQRAADIGQEAGLRYVYAGNLPGRVGSLEDTFCPKCTERLVKRRGFSVLEYRITAEGTCPKCKTTIAGVWTKEPSKVQIGGWGMPRRI